MALFDSTEREDLTLPNEKKQQSKTGRDPISFNKTRGSHVNYFFFFLCSFHSPSGGLVLRGFAKTTAVRGGVFRSVKDSVCGEMPKRERKHLNLASHALFRHKVTRGTRVLTAGTAVSSAQTDAQRR